MPEQILQLPPVRNFLDAVDQVMNSNTFLIDAGPALGSLSADEIATFVESEAFLQGMFACDRIREWWNVHEIDPHNLETLTWLPMPGTFTVENPAIHSEPATVEEFRQRLLWMLTEAFCPYAGRGAEHLPPDLARKLVDDFLAALEVSDSSQVTFVEPTFLYSTGYWIDEEEHILLDHHLPYFDGPLNESDTATFWVTGTAGYVLLTNGSP